MMVAKHPYTAIIVVLVTLYLTLRYVYHSNQEYATTTKTTNRENDPQQEGLQVGSKHNENKLHSEDHSQDLELHDIGEFFLHVETLTQTCNNLKVIGGMLHNFRGVPVVDGDRDVCLDKELGIKPGKCIVYSFGIRNEWSFDDSMAWYGCHVYTFDPTMNMKNHKRSNKISFYDLGIGNKDGNITINGKKCPVKRFTSIMSLLGHEKDVIIDYLKMDVEGAEIPFLEDVLQYNPQILQRINQIGMEIHLSEYKQSRMSVFKKYYKLIIQLESHGFRLISSKGNPYPYSSYYLSDVGRNVHKYYDLVWGRWPNTQ